jgi:hypothetical protein
VKYTAWKGVDRIDGFASRPCCEAANFALECVLSGPTHGLSVAPLLCGAIAPRKK